MKIPPETAAHLRSSQADEKSKNLWCGVEGFDPTANKFTVGESLQKCSPCGRSKLKKTGETWKIKFHETEDRDLFVRVLNKGVSFPGRRLQARNWLFSYSPEEL